ncbi:MAG: carboxypeptidase-like regulatory domain-containing protein, partial [Sediminibacterium sp.]
MSILFSWSYAQQTITGKVIDALSRQPIEAATVAVVSKEQGSVTDQFGNFSIQCADKTGTLTISFIGYKTTTVFIGKADNIRVELQRDVVSLQDVVVSKTGTLSKFNTLTKIDLDLKPVKNTQELMRVVPGLFVAQHAGGGK